MIKFQADGRWYTWAGGIGCTIDSIRTLKKKLLGVE